MSENKSSRRFTWVDWLIFLSVILCAGGGIWYWRWGKAATLPKRSIVYTLSISVSESFLGDTPWESLIPVGATVTNANGTAPMGTVASVEERPSLQAAVRDGGVVFVTLPDRRELLVRVRADATEKLGDGLRVHDIRIAAGLHGDFRVGALWAANAAVIRVETESVG